MDDYKMDEKIIEVSTPRSISSVSLQDSVDATKQTKQNDVAATQQGPGRQAIAILLGQMVVVFAISLDMTILTTTIPTIALALNATAIEASWIVSSYLLANAVVQPLMAALADIFGRRSVIFCSLVLFTIGSIICGASNTVAIMLVGRTIQGIGGGGVLALNLIIMSDIFPLRIRPKYISLQQLVVTIGFNIAPTIGGLIVKSTTWRWLFYINLPFCGLGLAIIPFLLKYEGAKTTAWTKLASVDWIGSIAFITGITTFLLGLTWAGNLFAWSSAATLVPLVAGPVVVILTGLYERFLAKNTFLRFSLFSSWSAVAVYVCSVLQALTLFSEMFFIVLYFLSVKLYTPLQAGVYCMAFAFVCLPTSALVGAAITRFGSYRWAILSGWIINTAALGVFTMLDASTPATAWVFMLMAGGIGQGLLFIALSSASQAASSPKDAGYAMGMYSFTRSLGLCLGVALGGVVFQNLLRQQCAATGLPAVIADNSEGFAYILQNMGASLARDEIIAAYTFAFQRLFGTMCGISGLGFLISFAIRRHTLDVELQTEHRLKGAGEQPSATNGIVVEEV